MAIITINEVAQVGDKFYTPGQYEVPDHSLFCDRSTAVIDFLGSNLVENNQITGLMVIKSNTVTLKRYDTIALDGGLSPEVDTCGTVVFREAPLTYQVVTMTPWTQKGTAATVTIESEAEVSVPKDGRYKTALNSDHLVITTSTAGEYNIPITLGGRPADPLVFTVSELKVTTETNKKGEPAVGKVICLEDDTFVPGLEITADDCTITEKKDHYEVIYTGTPAASVTVKVKVNDPVYPQRNWKVPDMKFWYADVAKITLDGLDTTPMETYMVEAVPTPALTYGAPVWSISGAATLTPKGTQAIVTPTGPGVFTVTAKWHKITATKEVTVTEAPDFVVYDMPTEVENGESYEISVTSNNAGSATFSTDIEGVTITDHNDNTARINVVSMTAPGVVTVHWGEFSEEFPLTVKK